MNNRYDYDVIVIGGGIAGFVSAVTANSFGKRVAIVEKRKVGGNCTNFTCIPSKALIRAAHVRKDAVHMDRLGLAGIQIDGVDTANVLSRVRSVIQEAYTKDLPETFQKIGIDVLPGGAEFVDPHRIIRECLVVSAEKFIIAVGTRPLVPPIKGLADIDYLTNENLYELNALPKSLTILGGGIDGFEYASAFVKLGVETTVVEMATRLLPMVDRELVNHLLDVLHAEGIRFLTGAKAEGFAKDRDGAILSYRYGDGQLGQVKSERVLVSIGRRPDLDGLLIEKAGVKSTPRGIITDRRLRTSAQNIYACGDIVGPYQLASTAEYQVIKALKAPLRKLYSVTHAYPTYAQALVGRASQLAYLDRMSESTLVKKSLMLYPGLENRLNLARERLAETEKLPSISLSAEFVPNQTIEVLDNDAGWIVRLPETLFDLNEEPIFSTLSGKDVRRSHSLILDFCRVTRINGLGADMLVKLCARAATNGWTVIVFGLPEGMRQILQVSELDQAMAIFGNETEALAAAGITGPNPVHSLCTAEPIRNLKQWAQPAAAISLAAPVTGARNLNVNGRRAVGPVNGFGQLCQIIFRLYIKGEAITPEAAIAALKQNFPSFQPSFNRFYPTPAGIAPGEIVLIDAMTPGGPVSTGVMVLYADDRSFTFCCPQGHPESGFVTFSAHEDDGRTIVQVLGLARANDPLYEAAYLFMGSRIQGRIWTHLLSALAAYLGVPADIVANSVCIDKAHRWSQAKNIWYNAQIRTMLYEPVHVLKKIIGTSKDKEAHAG